MIIVIACNSVKSLYGLFQELTSIGVKPVGLVRRLAKAAKKVNDSPIKSEIPVCHINNLCANLIFHST